MIGSKYLQLGLGYLIATLLLSDCHARKSAISSEASYDCELDTSAHDAIKVYLAVDEMPEYPGDLSSYIFRNIQIGPSDSNLYTVNLTFLVTQNGQVKSLTTNGHTADQQSNFEKELSRLIEASSPWTPGKCGDKTVAVKQNFKIYLSF